MNDIAYNEIKKICEKYEHPNKANILEVLKEIKPMQGLVNNVAVAGAVIYLGLYPYSTSMSVQSIWRAMVIMGYPVDVELINRNVKKIRRWRWKK